MEERQTPLHASPRWICQHYLGKIRKEAGLLLRGLDSRLSKDPPSDIQKLCCKVAFHTLRFAPHISEISNRIPERMQTKGPYLALHLRLKTDVWVRIGCSPGMNRQFDQMIENERMRHPELLTARSNMIAHERKLVGLCPLNALEVIRMLEEENRELAYVFQEKQQMAMEGSMRGTDKMTTFDHVIEKMNTHLKG